MRRLALFGVVAGLAVAAFSTAAISQAPASRDQELLPGKRMVHAVQFPYDLKVKFTLFPTGRIKEIEGRAEVRRRKAGIEVEVEVDGPPPSQLRPEYGGYVVWALTPAGKFFHLGALERKGTVKTTTKIPAFGIVVTAEADLQTATPTDPVLESGMPDAKARYYPIRRVFYTPAVQ